MNKFIIKNEKSIDLSKWNNFLLASGNTNLFSYIQYYRIIKAEIFFITAYDDNNLIIGGVICRIRGGLFPCSILSKSLWVESGLLVNSADTIQEKRIKNELLKSIIEDARAQKCIFIKLL